MSGTLSQSGSAGAASSGGSGSGPGALSLPAGVLYQAEDAGLSGGAGRGSDIAGFSGSGYAVFPGAGLAGSAAAAVTFTITTPQAGWYTLDFSFANGGLADGYRNLILDGRDIPGAVQFPNQFAASHWATTYDRVPLAAGAHSVTLTADLGLEQIGFGLEATPLLLDSLTVVAGTSPSNQTSARSLTFNNGPGNAETGLVGSLDAALLYQKDIQAFGPALASLHTGSNWGVDQVDFGTMWFQDASGGMPGRTYAPHFDSQQSFDAHGILHVQYGDYLPTGEALPVSISRDIAMVPNQSLMVERWTLTNQAAVGNPLIQWNAMNVLALNPELADHAVWDARRQAYVVEVDQGDGHGPVWMAFGAYQKLEGHDAVPLDQAGDLRAGSDLNAVREATDPQGPVGQFTALGTLADHATADGKGVVLALADDAINLYPTRPVELYYYTTVADSLAGLDQNIGLALNPQGGSAPGSPSFWFQQTQHDWDVRLAQATQLAEADPAAPGGHVITDPALNSAYLISLVSILQSQQPEFGSFLASTNPAYAEKVWPRDSAATAMGLDAAGLHDDAGRYLDWMASVVSHGTAADGANFPAGTFHTNFSFWEPNTPIPFVEPEWDAQGLFLVAVFEHVRGLQADGRAVDAQAFLADPVVTNAVVDVAQWINGHIDPVRGFGAPDFSIWEEFYLYNIYTQVTYAEGLNVAAQLATEIGRPDLAAGWVNGANTVRDAILRPTADANPGLWDAANGHFIWGITPEGALIDRLENSANLAIVTGLLDANDPRAISQIDASIALTGKDGFGISRYQGDTFYSSSPYSPGGTYESRADEPAWPQMTSYVGIAKAQQGDAAWALNSLEWTVSNYGAGFMAPGEGVDWSIREPLPSTMVEPVTASWYIQNLLTYTGQYDPRLPDAAFA